MFDELMLHGSEVALSHDGLHVPVRLPWYRSLPLSSIKRVDLVIDESPIHMDRIRLSLYGTSHTLEEVSNTDSVLWFVLDAAQLTVSGETIEAGSHRVDLAMTVRIPYGDADFRPMNFVQVSTCSKQMTALGEVA
jgi:hypothetical protein